MAGGYLLRRRGQPAQRLDQIFGTRQHEHETKQNSAAEQNGKQHMHLTKQLFNIR
ncbi:hypothetical protein D3C85_1889790 [compost metagenome]